GRYLGDVMDNRANGATGLDAYMPRSSAAQYLEAGGSGAAATASAYSLALAALISAGGYAADNQLAGKPFSLTNTVRVGGLSYLGGNFFEWGVGKVPASLLLKKLIVGNSFDTSSQVLLQNALDYSGGVNPSSSQSQALPVKVVQNGTTYYRNASGPTS